MKQGHTEKKRVAIFDVDGTIFRSSLLIELVEEFIAAGIFPAGANKHYEKQYKEWMDREGDYEAYISSVVAAFVNHIKGVAYKDFAEISDHIVRKYKNKVYRYTRDLVKDLKKEGYFLLAISQSPKGVLDGFCKHLGFDKVYGRVYELGPQERFTGKIVDEHLIANKSNIVKRAVEKENLTLEGSIAVGDTEGDIPMLESVEYPICFNPNMHLYRAAKRNNWKIVVERKDVIYEINTKNAS